jgi:phosphohistidine phosphatase
MNDTKHKSRRNTTSGDGSKQLLLIRHAKSSWDDLTISDFERPLNDRGKKDAPEMAKRLVDKKIKIDALVSSPAKRAKKTCKYFEKEFDISKDDIIFESKLYEAGTENFFEVVKNLKNKWDNVAIFSHNPGITDFANSLTNEKIDNIPTCGIFAVKIKSKHWSDFKDAEKEFLFFDYPRAGDEDK